MFVGNAVEFSKVYHRHYHLIEVTSTKLASLLVAAFANQYMSTAEDIKREDQLNMIEQYQGMRQHGQDINN